mgnify:CR=1 FL=1
MNLPRKDKDGISRLSYSQISLFKRSKSEYYESYIEGKPFEGNEYTDFGSKVGEALEHNNFKAFKKDEQETLKKVKRLDEFEREVRLNYEGFYVLGFIDSNKKDFTKIIDYKTGGLKKEFQYSKPDYNQLCLYALSLRQETGITPVEASVEFIRRKGNAFRGQALTVGDEVISIPVDISLERLKIVYWDTLNVAKEIEQFYKENMLN